MKKNLIWRFDLSEIAVRKGQINFCMRSTSYYPWILCSRQYRLLLNVMESLRIFVVKKKLYEKLQDIFTSRKKRSLRKKLITPRPYRLVTFRLMQLLLGFSQREYSCGKGFRAPMHRHKPSVLIVIYIRYYTLHVCYFRLTRRFIVI